MTKGSHVDTPANSNGVATAGSAPVIPHTPGPWKAVEGVGYVFTEGEPYGRGVMHVAQVRGWGHLTGRGGGCAFDEDKAIAIQEANARLIAAAPDLLAACREFVRKCDVGEARSVRSYTQMSAAIQKAEGR